MQQARASVELLQGAENYFPALIEAIGQAQSTIYIDSYLIHDDPQTQRVLDALIAARRRGVQVYLLLDGFGAAADAHWVRKQLMPHGIQVELYRPGWRWYAPKTWRRMHRKLVLIDEQIGFVGGINLIDDHHDPVHGQLAHPRLDFAARVTAWRVVRAMSRLMRRLWWRVSMRNAVQGGIDRFLKTGEGGVELRRVRETWRRTRRHLRWRGPAVRRDGLRHIRLLLRDNFRHRRSIEHWYLWHIRLAQREVLIANAYFVPTLRFRQALIRASSRGVRVRLLLQGNSDQWWTHWATQALTEELVASGIEVYQYTPSFLHAKVAVIDDAVTVGSSNIDPFSLMMSLEANLVTEDATVAAKLRSILEKAIDQESVRMQRRRLRPLPFPVMRAMARRVALTFALMALRIFIAFSRTRFQVN